MLLLRTVSLAAVAAIQILAPATTSQPVLVTRVFDGDTVDVAGVGHVRLLGIDAPELGRGFDTAAPYAAASRERLSALVLQRWIRLEYEGPREDAYGRKLAYLLLEDGTNVNAVLLREGLARISARIPLQRLDELRRAESEAQAFHRGMWRDAPDAQKETLDSSVTRSPKTSAKARPKPAGASKRTPKPKVYKAKAKKKKEQNSDIEHRMSDIGCRTSDIGHRISDIGYRISDIGLLRAEGDERIDARGAPGRQEARGDRDGRENGSDGGEGDRIA